ncbi:MAG: hypothetical protein EOM24_23625 [Chloroflexia bacterium]|nr:hypothetical protein [Chloroflexia bacterium]
MHDKTSLHTPGIERLYHGLEPALAASLSIDRATRDRLVIFDPASAPLLRPLIRAEAVLPWRVRAEQRWIIAIPESQAATIRQYTALARHLDSLTPPWQEANAATPWWVLPDDALRPVLAPRILVREDEATVAWDDTTALIAGPTQIIADADPFWLAWLGSATGQAALRKGISLAALQIPEVPGPTQGNLAGLALEAAHLASQIDELEAAVLRRILADFGPPGRQPGPRLLRWWLLDFEHLHEAVLDELRNDIPERYRPTWEQIHHDQRTTHEKASARLGTIIEAINTQVAALVES